MVRKAKTMKVQNIKRVAVSDGNRMIQPNEVADVPAKVGAILIEHGVCCEYIETTGTDGLPETEAVDLGDDEATDSPE